MNKSIATAAAALCILIAGVGPATAQVAEQSVPVPAPARGATYQPPGNEFNDYAYSYRLSNGQIADFSEQNNRYYVVIHNKAATDTAQAMQNQRATPVQILPTAPGRYVTRDGVDMSFANDGEMVTITNFERLPHARVAAGEAGKPVLAFR